MKKSLNQDWPKGAFFIVRFFQLLFAVIVVGILAFFVYHLRLDDYSVPWEFSILDLAAALTLINLVVNSAMFLCFSVSALAVIVVDLLLTILWATAFGMLAKAMGQTITGACTTSNWGDSDGVRVCNMFKALFAFAFLSLLATFVSLCFAVSVRKKQGFHTYEPAFNPNSIHEQSTAYAPLRERSSTLNATAVPQRYPSSHYSREGQTASVYRDNLDHNPFGEPTPSPHKPSVLEETYAHDQHPAFRQEQPPYQQPYSQEPVYQESAYHRDPPYQDAGYGGYGHPQAEPPYQHGEEGMPMQQNPYHQNPHYHG